MDPLSLTASIIAIIGVGTQTAKMLGKLSTAKNARPLAMALHNEVSDLQLNVLNVQELFQRSEKYSSQEARGPAIPGITASVSACLTKINQLALELEELLRPLLTTTSVPGSTSAKILSYWIRKETRLNRLKQDLRNARIELNTVTGTLNLNTSMRIESMTYDLRRELREHIQDYNAARMCFVDSLVSEEVTEQHIDENRSSSELAVAVKPYLNEDLQVFSKEPRDHIISITVTPISSQGVHGHCRCRCHQRNTIRSPKAFDRVAGVLFAGYSSIACLAPQCNINSCRNYCPMTSKDFASVKYFFPSWFLSWAVSLRIRNFEWGFDYAFRLMHCVSYSSPIFLSAYRGDATSMKMLLKAKMGSPFDVTAGERQKTLLTIAASRGHGDICTILVHAGADPLGVDDTDRSAVDIAWKAALSGNKLAQGLEILLAQSSSHDYAEKFNLGLLHRTVLGLARIDIKTLVDSASISEIEDKDEDGQTPLHWAALRGDYQALSLLIDAGANVNACNKYGASILTAAIMSGDSRCLQKIMETPNCDINYVQVDGYTPLHLCCRHNINIQVIEYLVCSGAHITARTKLGHTPLMIATFNLRSAVCNYLVANMEVGDLDIQGNDGGCALHHAVMTGDYQTVRLLLKFGANCGLKTHFGETLLHFAAQRSGDQEIIRTLEPFELEGIDPDDKNRHGHTALHIAANQHSCDIHWLEMFRVLIQKVSIRCMAQDLKSGAFEDAVEYQLL